MQPLLKNDRLKCGLAKPRTSAEPYAALGSVFRMQSHCGLVVSRFDHLTSIAMVSPSFSKPMTLDQFLKQTGIVGSGGQAKILIQEGEVLLNGVVETRRGKKLVPGDVVTIGDEVLRVPAE